MAIYMDRKYAFDCYSMGYLFYRITKNRDPLLQYKLVGLLRKRDRVNHVNTHPLAVP